MVFFCNRECQVANWKLHKKICGVAKDVKNRVGAFDVTHDAVTGEQQVKVAFSEESLNKSALDHQRREGSDDRLKSLVEQLNEILFRWRKLSSIQRKMKPVFTPKST